MSSVAAQVRYLNPEWKGRAEMPSIGDSESRRANTSKHGVEIHDARSIDADLDTSGFVLTEHASRMGDFHDKAEVAATYYDEVARLIKRLTGADEVFIAQHVVRTEETGDFNSAYARFVHCDYSISDIEGTVERSLENHSETLDPSRHWEFAWYNTWQPIEREVRKNPLAMVDTRTLDTGDVVDYEYAGFGKPVITAMPVFNPQHKFYFFPRMQTDEVLVIKQLETRPDRAVSCPHTSFDIEAPEDAPGRRSIEVRMMCAFSA